MVKRIFKLLYKEIRGLHQAAFLLGSFAVLSQVFALIRDRLLSHFFGVGAELDLYYAAFRIPDLLFASIASLVSLSVLIPLLSEKMERREDARQFMDSVVSVFMLLMLVASAVAYVLMPAGVRFLFPDLTTGAPDDTLVSLARIILLSPIFLGLSNVFASITQTKKKFFLYAVSPLLYNIGIIVGILFFRPLLGAPGLAWGVVLGALLHMAVQIPYLARGGLLPRPSVVLQLSLMRHVALLSLPRTLALAMGQFALLALLALAARMQEGSIAIFNLSYNLQSIPVSVIGVSYSVAAFPTLSRLFARGRRERYVSHIIAAARHVLFWSVPAGVLFVVLRAQIVRVILGSGKFTWDDTRLTAALLAVFAFSIAAQCLSLLLIRGLYAAGDTKKPLVLAGVSSLVAVFSAFGLVRLFASVPSFRYFLEALFRVGDVPGSDVLVLPLGFSLGMMGNALLLWIFYRRDFAIFGAPLGRTLFESVGSSMIMGTVSYGFLNALAPLLPTDTLHGIFLQGFLSGIGGIAVWVGVLHLLGSRELYEITDSLRRKFWVARPVAAEQGEL